jgi:hypothetical protein
LVYLLSTAAILVPTACNKELDALPAKTSKSADVPIEIQVKQFQRPPSIDASRKVVAAALTLPSQRRVTFGNWSKAWLPSTSSQRNKWKKFR